MEKYFNYFTKRRIRNFNIKGIYVMMLFFTLNFKQEWRIAAYIVKIMKVKYILKKHFSNERLFLVFHFLSLRSNLFSGLADLHGMKDKENISLLMAEANPVGIIFAFPGINTASNAIIIIIHLQGVDEKWSRQEAFPYWTFWALGWALDFLVTRKFLRFIRFGQFFRNILHSHLPATYFISTPTKIYSGA